MKPHYISLSPLVHWIKAKRPIKWDLIFKRSAPLQIEIGFGLGDFLVKRAIRCPDFNFIGIEIGWIPTRRALRKIAIAGVNNVKLIQVDAQVALERLVGQCSIEHIYSLFPCPWPKRKHFKKRLFSHYFLKLLSSRLVLYGEAIIVTDHGPYFHWLKSQIPGTGLEATGSKIPTGFRTKYEKKWRDLGQEEFFQLHLVKREHIAIPLREDINLITRRKEFFDPKRFSPSGINGEIVVKFKNFVFDSERQVGMLRCIVEEGGFLQDFWIDIAKANRYWHIRPSKGCGIVPTFGIQRALDLVYDAI